MQSSMQNAKDALNGFKSGMNNQHPGSYQATTTHQTTQYNPIPARSQIVSTAQNTRKVSEVVTSEQLVLPKTAYEQSSRKISSVVVFEEEERIPEKNVRYVEVPKYEEVVKTVPVREIREVEKIVPRIVEEWVERIVEIPQIEEVIRHVEIPQVVEEIKHVPRIEVVDRPYEVIKEVPRLEIQKVEKVVDIGAEIIEVAKASIVEQKVPMSTYHDSEAMLVVAQKVKPVIIDGAASHGQLAIRGQGEVVVDVAEYSPEVMPVDIHVAKFVDQELVMVNSAQHETIHRVVTVSAMQYNSMLRYLNAHLSPIEKENLPYLTDQTGTVQFLPQDFNWQAPAEGLKIYGYRPGQIWGQGNVVKTAKYSSGMSQQELNMKQNELDRQFQQIFSQFESEKTRKVNAVEHFNQSQVMQCQNIIRSANQSHHQSQYSHRPALAASYYQSTAATQNNDLFRAIDKNGDGNLSTKELLNAGVAIGKSLMK